MLNLCMAPEVSIFMIACEELFSRVVMTDDLMTLDREIIEYYAGELYKFIQVPDDQSVHAEVPSTPK
jgi:hypothetical protein